MAQEFEFRLSIKGPEISRVFPVPVGKTTIGRQDGNDVVLRHSQVSRQHARLDCTAGECQITDLDSSNGTRVNGEKLTPNVPTLLAPGTVVKIGPFELTFEQTPVEPPKVKATKVKAAPPAEELVAKPPPEAKPSPKPAKLTAEPVPEARPSPQVVAGASAPPPPAPPTPAGLASTEESFVPPGLSIHGPRLLNYLPGIYHTDFMARFLALFESILMPIEWNVDNFDLYLAPGTAPTDFLPWLANWYQIIFDATWSDAQRRTLLMEACQIYARRGTRWALSRVLEIYTGRAPEIADKDQDPFTFTVYLPVRKRDVDQEIIGAIVDANKPVHTTYTLKFKR